MLLSSVLAMSLFAVTTQQVNVTHEPLVLIEQYFVNQQSLSNDHPRMRKLRERIEDATENDFQFDLPKVQERFETLALERQSLVRTKSFTHPDVKENATRLSLVSRILAGQSSTVLKDISEPGK